MSGNEIADQANKLREQIQEYVLLQRNASQADSIQATAKALATLREGAIVWLGCYQACAPYLTAEQGPQLRHGAARLHMQLAISRTNFETNYNQQAALLQATKTLQGLQDSLRGYWGLYARGRLDPLTAQLRPARQLPSAREQVAQIEGLLRILEAAASQLPRTTQEVMAFHENVAKVQKMLGDITGFTPEQRAFLEKISLGTATLADVTAELLAWCKQAGLAATLRISR